MPVGCVWWRRLACFQSLTALLLLLLVCLVLLQRWIFCCSFITFLQLFTLALQCHSIQQKQKYHQWILISLGMLNSSPCCCIRIFVYCGNLNFTCFMFGILLSSPRGSFAIQSYFGVWHLVSTFNFIDLLKANRSKALCILSSFFILVRLEPLLAYTIVTRDWSS